MPGLYIFPNDTHHGKKVPVAGRRVSLQPVDYLRPMRIYFFPSMLQNKTKNTTSNSTGFRESGMNVLFRESKIYHIIHHIVI